MSAQLCNLLHPRAKPSTRTQTGKEMNKHTGRMHQIHKNQKNFKQHSCALGRPNFVLVCARTCSQHDIKSQNKEALSHARMYCLCRSACTSKEASLNLYTE